MNFSLLIVHPKETEGKVAHLLFSPNLEEGVLGSPAAVYRFEAVWHGRAVRTVVKEPVQSVRLECTCLLYTSRCV